MEDVLANILRRLPPRPLARCRSVSKHLRAAVDRRGIFIDYVGQDRPYFFSRPAPPGVDAELAFLLPHVGRLLEVAHHCNGRVLWGEQLCGRREHRIWPAESRWTGQLAGRGEPLVGFEVQVASIWLRGLRRVRRWRRHRTRAPGCG